MLTPKNNLFPIRNDILARVAKSFFMVDSEFQRIIYRMPAEEELTLFAEWFIMPCKYNG